MSSRKAVVDLAKSWIGKKESDKSYMEIINIYNSQKKFPRNVKMDPKWAWCACTWSALAIKLKYTDIMPVEISCNELIKLAKAMGIWKENDGYIPKPADAILYDWDDSGKGDNTGWPDHVGVVETVNQKSGYFTVIEGNYSNAVKRRTVSINGKFIRGFITPKYTEDGTETATKAMGSNSLKNISTVVHEVIAGDWGDDEDRRNSLKAAGYNPEQIQENVNRILNGSAAKPRKVTGTYNKAVRATCNAAATDKSIVGSYKTTANLYCRNDAGKNKKALCLIPKGIKVACAGKKTGNWYLIEVVMDNVLYEGFSHNSYLTKL